MEDGTSRSSHKMVTKAIERAQKQVEGRNFEIRKHLLEYDDVMNKQREAVYRLRREILERESRDARLHPSRGGRDRRRTCSTSFCPERPTRRDWDTGALENEYRAYFGFTVGDLGVEAGKRSTGPQLETLLIEALKAHATRRVEKFGEEEFASSRSSCCSTPSTVSGRTTCWPSTIS